MRRVVLPLPPTSTRTRSRGRNRSSYSLGPSKRARTSLNRAMLASGACHEIFSNSPEQLCTIATASSKLNHKTSICQTKHPWFEALQELLGQSYFADLPRCHARREQNMGPDLTQRYKSDQRQRTRCPFRCGCFSVAFSIPWGVLQMQAASVEGHQQKIPEPCILGALPGDRSDHLLEELQDRFYSSRSRALQIAARVAITDFMSGYLSRTLPTSCRSTSRALTRPSVPPRSRGTYQICGKLAVTDALPLRLLENPLHHCPWKALTDRSK